MDPLDPFWGDPFGVDNDGEDEDAPDIPQAEFGDAWNGYQAYCIQMHMDNRDHETMSLGQWYQEHRKATEQ